MSKILLDKVTLFSIYAPFNGEFNLSLFNETINAIEKSMSEIDFAKAVLVTDKSVCETFGKDLLKKNIFCEEYICSINSIDDYSKYMVYNLYKHFDTDFVLTVQHDGYVINPKKWIDDFLKYDYIGAPWQVRDNAYLSPFNEHIRVGNGGFSLRSKKLATTPLKIDIPFDCTSGDFYKHFNQNNFNEDGCIAVHNRHLYEKNGCVFAPVEVAAMFSYELPVEENIGIVPFGFHKNFPGGAF